MRIQRRVVMGLVTQLLMIAALTGCGGSSRPASSATGGNAAISTNVAATIAAHPGCGTYCAEAGIGQATVPLGYPCPAQGCLKCPAAYCMQLLSTRAVVSHGIFTVKMACNLSTPCVGAFLLCVPNDLCGEGPNLPSVYRGRIAGSDFTIPPKEQADVPVALTPLGQRFVSNPRGNRADVLLDLRNYGDIHVPVPPALPEIEPASYYDASIQLAP